MLIKKSAAIQLVQILYYLCHDIKLNLKKNTFMKKTVFFIFAMALAIGANAQWIIQSTNFPDEATGIRNISIASDDVVWISSYDGSGSNAHLRTISKTTNGGDNWTASRVDVIPSNCDIAMIHGIDANNAWIAANPTGANGAGQGVYRTSDGGTTWARQETAEFTASGAFANVVWMDAQGNGFCQGDPTGGYFELYTTTNFGENWTRVPQANIPAHLVSIKNSEGKYVEGVVSSKPPHFMSQAEREQPLSIDHLTIDVGASSREEVINEFKIEVGAPVVPAVKFSYNEQNKVMRGKGFDNRLGCAAILKTMEAIKNENLKVNVVGAFAVQEEVGLRGATVSSRTVKPDLAIVFEGTPADDSFANKYQAQSVLGKGPQIRHRDGSYISNHRFLKLAKEIATKNSIPFQNAVRAAGGTNAGQIHLSNEGVPVLVMAVPSRYIHTHYSYASSVDFENTVKLATEIIKSLNDDIVTSLIDLTPNS